jgi:hypothetical protein
MSNLIGRTNAYVAPDGPPQHPPEAIDDEWLPLLSGAPRLASDAASCRQEHTLLAKRMLGVSRSLSMSSAYLKFVLRMASVAHSPTRSANIL